MVPNSKSPQYYRDFLKAPLFGLTNHLRFDFTFEDEDGGSYLLTDLKTHKLYGGNFRLRFSDGSCSLGIWANNFEIHITDRCKKLVDYPFDQQIKFLSQDLIGFLDKIEPGL